MKRIIAVALALMTLFGAIGACAETLVSTVELSNLSVAFVEDGRAKAAHRTGMMLTLSFGSTEGVPTLQATFENGQGQAVDGIFQIVEDRLLVSAGGVSGTYYVDLEPLVSEPGSGLRLAKGVGNGLALAGPHLDTLLQGLSTVDSTGERRLDFFLPEEIYAPIAEAALNIVGGVGFLGDKHMAEAEERLDDADGSVAMVVRFKPRSEEVVIDLLQGGDGLRLSADMWLNVQPMGMVNISQDEMMYDLMHLGFARLIELRGELAIIALKFVKFAGNVGLGGLAE